MNENQQINITPEGNHITIEHIHHQERKVNEWNVLKLGTTDVESFAKIIKFRGFTDATIISITGETTATAILDDHIQDRPQDAVGLTLQYGFEYSDWTKILGKKLQQKQVVDFLKNRDQDSVHEIEQLIVTFTKLKTVTQIIGEYENDDEGNTTFMFKSQNGEGHASIPKYIYVTMPVFDNTDKEVSFEFEVEFIRPKAENEKPLFVITCPRLDRYVREASDYEMDKLKSELKDYVILNNKR